MERSRDWIRQARRGLEVPRELMLREFYEWACFLARQTAEKVVEFREDLLSKIQ